MNDYGSKRWDQVKCSNTISHQITLTSWGWTRPTSIYPTDPYYSPDKIETRITGIGGEWTRHSSRKSDWSIVRIRKCFTHISWKDRIKLRSRIASYNIFRNIYLSTIIKQTSAISMYYNTITRAWVVVKWLKNGHCTNSNNHITVIINLSGIVTSPEYEIFPSVNVSRASRDSMI